MAQLTSKSGRLVTQGSPSYLRVAQTLIGDIESGRFPVESLLPTEHELAVQFGISRHTVREAIRRLQALGLVTRQQGIGTRVKAAAPTGGYVQRAATIADLIQYAKDVELKIDSVSDVIADDELARRLTCRKGQRWLHISGLRYPVGESMPICLTEVYIAYEFASIRNRLGQSNDAIYRLLEEYFNVRIADVLQRISATRMTPEVAERLQAAKGGPGLAIARYYQSIDGRLIEAAFSTYPADRFNYESRLTLDSPVV